MPLGEEAAQPGAPLIDGGDGASGASGGAAPPADVAAANNGSLIVSFLTLVLSIPALIGA